MAPGLANARRRAVQNLQMPHPRDWQGEQMPRTSRGWGGGVWAQLELTDALASSKPFFTGNNSFNPKNEPSNGIEKKQVHFLQYIVHFVNPNMWMLINF